MASNNYPFEHVGQYDGKGIMKPSQFVRTRNIGELAIQLPKPPRKEDIQGHNLPKKQQKWTPTPIPKDFDQLPDEEQMFFMRREIKRRREGFWFYSNGTIEYVTGVHYWILCYWKLDVGLPNFIDAQRDFFYFWDLCVQDPDCFGEAYYTNRRFGKTAMGTGIVYEYASSNKESNCGMQSKTNPDAGEIFRKMVSSWKKLHHIWKPTDSGDTNPRKELRFEEPSHRSTKGVKKEYQKVLNSIISYKPSVEEAYDGYKLKIYYDDEFGKFVEGNAYTRWDIVKPCLVIGTRIIGKSLHTTTVEELERKGGQAALDMWNDSDPNERKKDGRTKSGLYRYFKPAYYGLEGYIDQYGYSDIEGAKQALLDQRDGLTGPRLSGEIRKFPFNPQEAFMMDDKSEVFSSFKIYQQKNHNEILDAGTVSRGNFIWEDMAKTKVKFVHDPTGRWLVTDLLDPSRRNAQTMIKGHPAPGNTNIYSGVDPYDHDQTTDNKKSDACVAVFKTADVTHPQSSNSFICLYLHRPDLSDMFYDDALRTFVYYGSPALIESQKPGLIKYLKRKGYHHYMMKVRKSDYTKSNSRNWEEGQSMAGEIIREEVVDSLATYIYNYVGELSQEAMQQLGIESTDPVLGQCYFDDLLNDWLSFDIRKWTDYDATVASGLALIAQKYGKKYKRTQNKININELFPKYDNRGLRSKLL